MIIAFCLPQFKSENSSLQPWLTVEKLADRFANNGHKVHVITDAHRVKLKNGISIHGVRSLWGTNKKEIKNILKKILPDILIISVTPFSLFTSQWYPKIKKIKLYAFVSYPLYNITEIKRALPYLTWGEKLSYGRNLLVPARVWGRKFDDLFDGIFCQSERTGKRIKKQVLSKKSVHVIPPGIDKDLWNGIIYLKKKVDERTVFLYTGGIGKIRGLPIILDAFSKICRPDMKLKILVRGAENPEIREIKEKVMRRQISGNVAVTGGWLEKDDLKKEIKKASAVLLPFILVPSELPVTVMEVISCGIPVIVSDIDGLPDAVGNAGIVVKQADVNSLADAMMRIYLKKDSLEQFAANCLRRCENMHSWDAVAKQWLNVLEKKHEV